MKRVLSLVALALVTMAVFGQGGGIPASLSKGDANTGDVPAYNAAPPRKGSTLPPILPAEQLIGPSFQHPAQTKSYLLAAKIPGILYQMPCYCYCDRSVGHNSLRSCFESTHGAHCSTCMQEVFYVYSMHKKGKTVAQIRKGIITGEWQKVDLQTVASME